MRLINSDYSFMTIGEGKKAHIARVVKGSTKYAYALCTISGKFGYVFDPFAGDVCKSCLKLHQRTNDRGKG